MRSLATLSRWSAKMGAPRRLAKSASSSSRAHTLPWGIGSTDVVPTSAPTHSAPVQIERFARATSCVKGPNGLLERVGRKDRQAKIHGTRVNLDGVEVALRRHAFVRDVAVLARTSNVDATSTLIAYVNARAGSPSRLIQELRELVRSVPPPMRPARFYLLHDIPRLPSSKVDIRALTALDDANVQSERAALSAETRRAPVAGDRIAQTVARVWEKVLLAPVAGVEDHFFDAAAARCKRSSSRSSSNAHWAWSCHRR